jgi:pimeloyl-ACP methyl ester carboxylesterase
MANTNYGTFGNGTPFARLGSGEKVMLLFYGGPGNGIPRGFGLDFIISGLKVFLKDYTLYVLTRRSGLEEGYTTRRMSDDYAELIREEFGGHVDVVIGISFGGMIAQHFAADHAELCNHLVIAMSTLNLTADGARVDLRYAELVSQGRDREAAVVITEAIYPHGVMRWVMSSIMWLMGGSFVGQHGDTFNRDVLIEARAEVEHDALESIKRISVPILLLIGGEDFYFPAESAREMATLIPNAMLKIYPGKGHEIMNEKQFGEDIRAFIERTRQ